MARWNATQGSVQTRNLPPVQGCYTVTQTDLYPKKTRTVKKMPGDKNTTQIIAVAYLDMLFDAPTSACTPPRMLLTLLLSGCLQNNLETACILIGQIIWVIY